MLKCDKAASYLLHFASKYSNVHCYKFWMQFSGQAIHSEASTTKPKEATTKRNIRIQLSAKATILSYYTVTVYAAE